MSGRPRVLAALWCVIAAGCATFTGNRDTEERAANHMRVADSLKQAAALAEAAFEYRLVVQHYPQSSVYALALKKGAILYLNPDNPAHNDSIATSMLSEYLALPIPGPEREDARIYMSLLNRIQELQDRLSTRQGAIDSLLAISRKQGTSSVSQTQRIQELESQLRSMTAELKRLKDVDVRISKSRIKRQQP